MERIKPFLKWPGGKFKLIDRIQSQFPLSGNYIEPFVGAGSMALNVDFPKVLINDANPHLVNVWKTIQTNPRSIIEECQYLFSGQFNDVDSYYDLRKEFNGNKGSSVRQAALFIYLNKHCFNGVCRFNKKGEFNVPFGKRKTVNFDAEHILVLSRKIQNWEITNVDYTHILLRAGKGDVVYADPPYVQDEQTTSGFTAYSKEGFSLEDQKQLAFSAACAASRGATVLISNHNTKFTRNLYESLGAEIVTFDVQRNVSCKGNKRHKASELLAIFPAK